MSSLPQYPVDTPNIPGGFTYDFNANYAVTAVRALIPDCDVTHPIFNDDEISFYLTLTGQMGIYTSSQSDPTGANVGLGGNQYDYLRAAAQALDVLASSKARLAVISGMLDVKLSAKDVQQALHAQAEAYREQSDNSGAFAIAEMVQDSFSARERTWKVWNRLLGP
jgi:hypothetical protein